MSCKAPQSPMRKPRRRQRCVRPMCQWNVIATHTHKHNLQMECRYFLASALCTAVLHSASEEGKFSRQCQQMPALVVYRICIAVLFWMIATSAWLDIHTKTKTNDTLLPFAQTKGSMSSWVTSSLRPFTIHKTLKSVQVLSRKYMVHFWCTRANKLRFPRLFPSLRLCGECGLRRWDGADHCIVKMLDIRRLFPFYDHACHLLEA